MAEMPGVLPLAVTGPQIHVLDQGTLFVALLQVFHTRGAKLLGVDAPSPQHTVTVGRQMNCGARLVCKTRLFIDLKETR
jgi:hypothetical protein